VRSQIVKTADTPQWSNLHHHIIFQVRTVEANQFYHPLWEIKVTDCGTMQQTPRAQNDVTKSYPDVREV
jgi:hypothetical protein